ncbi:MAG: GNAT family N-acetyltransferase [Rhizobiales bacterium]|nr:GNAT family N-acetyltransferase [Hyphomicrobiales bacterium]
MDNQFLRISEVRSDEERAEAGEMLFGFLKWNRQRLASGWPVEAFEVQERVRDDLINLSKRAAQESWTIFIAKLGQELAGCVVVRPVDRDACELKRLFVVPHLQRAGVGRALCQKALETARERGFKRMLLDTADLQVEAVSLFEDLGFRRSAPHRDYTPEVRSRVVFMVKDLD